jgi:hypothetical protein
MLDFSNHFQFKVQLEVDRLQVKVLASLAPASTAASLTIVRGPVLYNSASDIMMSSEMVKFNK